MTARKSNFYFTIFEAIKQGKNPAKISKELNISKQRLNYYLSSLKKRGAIEKIGYGTWQVKVKEVKNDSPRIAPPQPAKTFTSLNNFKPNNVRSHAFQFTLELPKSLRNWQNRREILTRLGIPYKELNNFFGGAELILFKGRKIILTNRSIIVFEPKSYIAETARDGKSYAIAEFLSLVKALETSLHANFSYDSRYKFKVSRQHHSLIKNELARQYDQEGKRLYVYQYGEQWFIIDNSFNLHEAETVHPETADTDNKKVQDFFNDLRINPTTLSEMRTEYYNAFVKLAKQIELHLSVVKEIKELINVLKESENLKGGKIK